MMTKNLKPIGATAALLVLLAALTAGPATAAGDARSLAMGGARTAAARGLDAASANPANLAFSPGVTVGLAGATADLHNNSFSLGRYNEVAGQTLSVADKERLLADIPDGGFALDTNISAGALGVQVGNFAVTTGAVGAGRGNLDRDFFDLVLFGNELGQTADFSDSWGEGYAIGKASLSYGQAVYQGSLGRVAVGATASYLHGLYEMHVEEAYGSLTTSMSEISGEAYASAITAEGGSGYGLDLGASWQAPGGYTFGIAMDNVVANLDWNGTVERTEFRVTASEINALNDDLDNAVSDSDTTYAVEAFSSTLPRRLRLGAARDTGNFMLAADYVQGFENRAGSSTTPRINLGVEWKPLSWLSPRGGLSMGGAAGNGLALGLGLNLPVFQLDVAVVNRGGFTSDDSQGLGFGLSTRLVF